jgi:hypothetical protein
MAPEVFENKSLSSALDVYSFGIVLWEICTRLTEWYKPLKKTFEQDVVLHKKRPDISLVKYKELSNIIVECWDHNPDDRPGFESLCGSLQQARVDIFLSGFEEARKFWVENWNHHYVPFENFYTTLKDYLYIKGDKEEMYKEMLKRILCPKSDVEVGVEDHITIESLQRLLYWFGPLKQNGTTIVASVEAMARNSWFFGVVTAAEAQQRLSGTPPGTFFVRLNTGKGKSVEEAPFIVSRVDPHTFEVRHTYVLRSRKGYSVKMPRGINRLSGISHQPEGGKKGRRKETSSEESAEKTEDSKGRTLKGSTVKKVLTRMSELHVKVKIDGAIQDLPFIAPLCPGHPFADLLQPASGRTPRPLSRHQDAYDGSSSSGS